MISSGFHSLCTETLILLIIKSHMLKSLKSFIRISINKSKTWIILRGMFWKSRKDTTPISCGMRSSLRRAQSGSWNLPLFWGLIKFSTWSYWWSIPKSKNPHRIISFLSLKKISILLMSRSKDLFFIEPTWWMIQKRVCISSTSPKT